MPNDVSTPSPYGRPGLGDDLMAALAAAGKDIENLTPDDFAPFENIHVRGRSATRDLARLAGLRPGARVLHVGCGIGGPARTLAVEYGCRVTGIDMTESYVEAGRMLTERVGLNEAVSLFVGNGLCLPFEGGSFDVVWMQHVGMNVADKAGFYREARRALHPGGLLALHEILAGGVSPPHYPVPWANDPSFSFLANSGRLRETLAESGFREISWRDDTPKSVEWALRPLADDRSGGMPDALDALLGPDSWRRIENVKRNLIERRIAIMQAVYSTALPSCNT